MIVKEELEALVSRYQARLGELLQSMDNYEKEIEKTQEKIADYRILIDKLNATFIDTKRRKEELQEFIEQTW